MSNVTQQDIERLERRAERERKARLEAERLLEEESRRLFAANAALKAAHDAEIKSAAYMRTVLDDLPIGVFVCDVRGRVEFLNIEARTLFRTAASQLRGLTIADLIADIPAKAGAAGNWDALNAADNVNATRPDGTTFPCEVRVSEIDDDGHKSILLTFRDISRRVAAEENKTALESELRRTQKLESLGTMAGGIAHELNTPIQFITDNTKFLSDAFRDLRAAVADLNKLVPSENADAIAATHDLAFLDAEVPQAISQSLEGLGRVAEIVLAIKRFSHPSSAKMEDNNINEIIKTTATVARNQWKYVADMQMDLDAGLPSIKSNAGELNQVLLNLIVNAAHAIEDKNADGAKGIITIRTRDTGDAVECSVTDTGIGIKPEIKDKLFDLFFTTKAPGRGTGQGLSLVHTIVTQSHKGKISIDSVPGEGTTFTITLPKGI